MQQALTLIVGFLIWLRYTPVSKMKDMTGWLTASSVNCSGVVGRHSYWVYNWVLHKLCIPCYKLGGSSPDCRLSDSRGVSERIPRVWQNIYFYCCNYVGNQFKAPRGFVVYGQYTTTKGCSYAWRMVECLDTALSREILPIYQTPEVPYYYDKLVTNIIRAVNELDSV